MSRPIKKHIVGILKSQPIFACLLGTIHKSIKQVFLTSCLINHQGFFYFIFFFFFWGGGGGGGNLRPITNGFFCLISRVQSLLATASSVFFLKKI